MEKSSTVVAYATAGTTGLLGLSLNEWGILVGIAATIGTFAVNLYFQLRAARRAEGKS
jgi:Bacteriophage holin family HP1